MIYDILGLTNPITVPNRTALRMFIRWIILVALLSILRAKWLLHFMGRALVKAASIGTGHNTCESTHHVGDRNSLRRLCHVLLHFKLVTGAVKATLRLIGDHVLLQHLPLHVGRLSVDHCLSVVLIVLRAAATATRPTELKVRLCSREEELRVLPRVLLRRCVLILVLLVC